MTLPGFWFRASGTKLQHWRRNGFPSTVCGARVQMMDDGSLLPQEGIEPCHTCMTAFQEEARKHLPEYQAIVNRLIDIICETSTTENLRSPEPPDRR